MGSAVITARAAATFEPVGRSVATARAFVRDTLQGWGYNDVVDDAVVLTSELVTNAVVHAGTAAVSRSPTTIPNARSPSRATASTSAAPTARTAAACCSAPHWPPAGVS